jgi:hypothetical protein
MKQSCLTSTQENVNNGIASQARNNQAFLLRFAQLLVFSF